MRSSAMICSSIVSMPMISLPASFALFIKYWSRKTEESSDMDMPSCIPIRNKLTEFGILVRRHKHFERRIAGHRKIFHHAENIDIAKIFHVDLHAETFAFGNV